MRSLFETLDITICPQTDVRGAVSVRQSRTFVQVRLADGLSAIRNSFPKAAQTTGKDNGSIDLGTRSLELYFAARRSGCDAGAKGMPLLGGHRRIFNAGGLAPARLTLDLAGGLAQARGSDAAT